MERIEAISEGEWNCLNGLFSEEAEFMAQLLRNCSLPNEVQNDTDIPVSSMFWLSNGNITGVDESAMYSSDETNTSTYSFSQGSGICLPFPSHESFCPSGSHQVFVDKNDYMTMDYCMMEDKNNSCQAHAPDVMGRDKLNLDVSNVSIQSNNNMCEDVLQGKEMEVGKVLAIPSPWESKKRSRIPGEFQRKKRSVKVPRVDESNEDNNNNSNAFVVQRQKSSSCCSEDESNASHEVNGVTSSSSSKGSRALNLDGKTRANRGSATDPQSLYARKRRERINERLRILQKLVPNGTKVDISTMLEEAVQYVKFLQLQIKLLSSDEMWMYAPIAYNGMDIGLDLKISTPHQQS